MSPTFAIIDGDGHVGGFFQSSWVGIKWTGNLTLTPFPAKLKTNQVWYPRPFINRPLLKLLQEFNNVTNV